MSITPESGILNAAYWFMMQPAVVTIIIGSLTALTMIIGLVYVLRKWGDIS